MSQKQVFISYSRQNNTFVDRLMSDLEQVGFSLWRDKESLETGTPSWERAIREAIKDAGAFVLVASPAALESDYVQGEITLAKTYHCPIYAIWAEGEQWIECVPLDMANFQYADGRGENYSAGVDELSKSLGKVFDWSDGSITLGLPTHETIELNLAQFATGFDILSYVWMVHLQDWYAPFSYGGEWIIANVHTKQLAMPWQWLTVDASDSSKIQMLNMLAGTVSYQEFGIRDGSYWAIWDARRLKAFGVFTNDDTIRELALSKTGTTELTAMVRWNQLAQKPIEDIAPSLYKHRLVVATFSKPENRTGFVDIDD